MNDCSLESKYSSIPYETSRPSHPVLMSSRDPEISDHERRLRRYGKGLNLTSPTKVIKPVGAGRIKRKTDINKWACPPPGFAPLSSEESDPNEDIRLCSSPFSFGFAV